MIPVDDSEPKAQSKFLEFWMVTPDDIIELYIIQSSSKSSNLDILPTHLVKVSIVDLASFIAYL